MSWIQLPLPGAQVRYWPAWLSQPEAAALFDTLLNDIAWQTHRIRLFGKWVDSPRRSYWIGDPGASYTYSGTRFVPQPWLSALQPLRMRLSNELGVAFNSVLANMYRDGRDCMGWHSDNEAELGPQPIIASLSLGAPRRFLFKACKGDRRIECLLHGGDLLVMDGHTQRHYRHALPRTAKPVAARINLTFRRIQTPG